MKVRALTFHTLVLCALWTKSVFALQSSDGELIKSGKNQIFIQHIGQMHGQVKQLYLRFTFETNSLDSMMSELTKDYELMSKVPQMDLKKVMMNSYKMAKSAFNLYKTAKSSVVVEESPLKETSIVIDLELDVGNGDSKMDFLNDFRLDDLLNGLNDDKMKNIAKFVGKFLQKSAEILWKSTNFETTLQNSNFITLGLNENIKRQFDDALKAYYAFDESYEVIDKFHSVTFTKGEAGNYEFIVHVSMMKRGDYVLELYQIMEQVPLVYKNEIMIQFKDLNMLGIDEKHSTFTIIDPNIWHATRGAKDPKDLSDMENVDISEFRDLKEIAKTCEGAIFSRNFESAENLCPAKFSIPTNFAVKLKNSKIFSYTVPFEDIKLVCDGLEMTIRMENFQTIDLSSKSCRFVNQLKILKSKSFDFSESNYDLKIVEVEEQDLRTLWPTLSHPTFHKNEEL